MKRPSIKFVRSSTRDMSVYKAWKTPNFTRKTVLTDSTWRYVEIYLKHKKSEEALSFWQQARNFYEASQVISLESAPLTIYYCFLNASKALLTAKGATFSGYHGVSGRRDHGYSKLKNEYASFKVTGILPALCYYFNEPVPHITRYSLRDILYNLEFIHRAYHLTYENEEELFVPIINPRFVYDKNLNKGWFEAQLETEHSTSKTINQLIDFEQDSNYDNSTFYIIKSKQSFLWDTPRNAATQASKEAFKQFYSVIRRKLRYIYSPNQLWYIKLGGLNIRVIDRHPLTLTYAAMHRLSELARYNPRSLMVFTQSGEQWLLSEFISKSLHQFIDNISSEITGDDFRVTGFRV